MEATDPKLQYSWTIWEQLQQAADAKAAQYADATHRVASFGTVKEFWRYWNHLPQPSQLLDGNKRFVRETDGTRSIVDALMVFRDGIRPEWEDPANASGGHFQFQLKDAVGGGTIDEYWNNIVLGMIGGTVGPSELVTGVRLVDKRQQRSGFLRLEVWFSNYEASDQVDQLQRSLERCMASKLDGSQTSSPAWGKLDKKAHSAHSTIAGPKK